jgi:RNA polymerase sigma factor (sigma-70 family)
MPGYHSRKILVKPFESEAELWEAFKNGSETAYAHLFQQYAYLLYSYGNKISPDADLVEDCLQDLFIKLWVNKSKLGEAPSIKNYLLKAFRRLLQDAVQKTRLKQEASEKELDFKLTLTSESENAQQQLQLEKEKKLQLAIEKLSSRQKEVIYLRFYKKMANEEIAEVMDISVPSVYNLVSKALVVLEKHLYFLSLLILFCLIPSLV